MAYIESVYFLPARRVRLAVYFLVVCIVPYINPYAALTLIYYYYAFKYRARAIEPLEVRAPDMTLQLP